MDRRIGLLAASLLALMLSGCGPLIVSPLYPKDWAPLISIGQKNQCADIAGSYLVKSEPAPIWEKQKPVYYSYKFHRRPFEPPTPDQLERRYLPTYLFDFDYKVGKPANIEMVHLLKQLSEVSGAAMVEIRQTNKDRIDILVYINEELAMKQSLTRVGFNIDILGLGPDENKYKCTPQGIEIAGVYIHDVNEYISNDSYYYGMHYGLNGAHRIFRKAVDGTLVMFEKVYVCTGKGCEFFDYRKWWRWRPVNK